jgi:hypothetical protein
MNLNTLQIKVTGKIAIRGWRKLCNIKHLHSCSSSGIGKIKRRRTKF